MKPRNVWAFVLLSILVSCRTVTDENDLFSRFSQVTETSEMTDFLVREVRNPVNARLLEEKDGYRRYMLLNPIQYGIFAIEAGEIIEVYAGGHLKSITFKHDWFYIINDITVSLKGNHRAEFHRNNYLKKAVLAEDFVSSGNQKLVIPSGSELLFWENGNFKRILSDRPVRVLVPIEGIFYFDSPIYFYENGLPAYAVLNKKTDSHVLEYAARSYPFYWYEDGYAARLTASDQGYVVKKARVKPFTEIYYFENGQTQHIILDSDYPRGPNNALQGGSAVNYQDSEETEYKFITAVNDFTISFWGGRIAVKGGERLYFEDGNIRRFVAAEDFVFSAAYSVQAGTEVILYPDGYTAKVTPLPEEWENSGLRFLEGSAVYYYPEFQGIMLARMIGTEASDYDQQTVYEYYLSPEGERIATVFYTFNAQGEMERRGIEYGAGSSQENEAAMDAVIRRMEEIDNMYLEWEWNWPGYEIFEDFATGELRIVE